MNAPQILMQCTHCGDDFYADESAAHALECRETQDDYTSSLGDVAFGYGARGPFDYIDTGCQRLIKRWTFPEHVQSCEECHECLTTHLLETATIVPPLSPENRNDN